MQQWQGLLKGQRYLLKEGMIRYSSRHLRSCLERSSWMHMLAIYRLQLDLWSGHFMYPPKRWPFAASIPSVIIPPQDSSNGCITRYYHLLHFLAMHSLISISFLQSKLLNFENNMRFSMSYYLSSSKQNSHVAIQNHYKFRWLEIEKW